MFSVPKLIRLRAQEFSFLVFMSVGDDFLSLVACRGEIRRDAWFSSIFIWLRNSSCWNNLVLSIYGLQSCYRTKLWECEKSMFSSKLQRTWVKLNVEGYWPRSMKWTVLLQIAIALWFIRLTPAVRINISLLRRFLQNRKWSTQRKMARFVFDPVVHCNKVDNRTALSRCYNFTICCSIVHVFQIQSCMKYAV